MTRFETRTPSNRSGITGALTVVVLALAASGVALAQPAISRQVVAAAGQQSTGGLYEIRATLGQGIAGGVSAGSVEVRAGFWFGDPGATVSVPDDGDESPPRIPGSFQLLPPHPNPTTSAATIVFELPVAARAFLAVYDVRGARVRTLLDRNESADRHAATWDGRAESGKEVPAGMYYFRLEAGAFRAVRSITLIH